MKKQTKKETTLRQADIQMFIERIAYKGCKTADIYIRCYFIVMISICIKMT